MKYFTPDLYQRLQDFSSDAAMDAAEAAWEGVRRRYQRYLRRLFPTLPRGLKGLLEKFYLHDAEVLSMGEHDKTFVMVLRLDVPPKELLVLNYRLTKPVVINRAALPSRNAGPVQWICDEVSQVRGRQRSLTHSILLSNGWEITLDLADMKVVRAQTVYQAQGTSLVPMTGNGVAKSLPAHTSAR